MAKLIFEQGVVQERTDLNPVTGCWRVVYQKLGEGATFFKLLDDEEALPTEKKGILKKVVSKALASGPEYLVYAVSKDQNLMLEFPRRIAHQNHVNYFDLYYKVEYHVTDPKMLVERLRAAKEDPLSRLRDTIGDELGGACSKVAWEIVKDEFAFSEVAEELTSPETEGFRKIQGKARYLGLLVTEIKLALRLLEIDVAEPKRDFQHQRTLAEKKRDLQITHADQDIKDAVKVRELRRQTWEGGTQAINASLNRIGSDTDTAAKLRENLDEIGGIFFPQMNTPGTDAPALPQRSPKLLAENANGLTGQGLSLLQQVISVVLQLDLREKEKRAFLSAIFHLAGALMADGDSQPEDLAHYREIYQAILDQYIHEMTVPQHHTLEELLNTERL